MRTAGGRVATVTLNDMGWYSATLDNNVDLARDEGGAGESIKKQRSFFAADQGVLLQTVPKVERSKKKADTPLRLRDKDGAIVGRTTMKVWSKESGLDMPKGYKDHHVIEVKVQKSWTTAKWSPSTGARTIHYATVDGLKVELDGPAATARGADGRHVLDIAKLKFLPRGEFLDQSGKATIGTDERDSPWLLGASEQNGSILRSRLEAVPVDAEELIVFASENCVGPANATEQDRLVEGCYLARNRVLTFDGQLKLTFGGYTEAEANRAAGVWSIACALDHLKGEFDDSAIFNGLSDELRDAARKARAGEPWNDNLENFLVPVPSEKELAAVRAYNEAAERHGIPPMEIGVVEKIGTFAEAPRTEGRRRAADVMVEMDNTLTGLRRLFVGVGLTDFRPAAPGSARWQDCFWFGDKHAISHGLNVAVEDTYQKSLAEAAESREDLLVVLRRVARREGLFAKIVAEADVEITTPAQLALFEREYDVATALNEGVVTRHSMYFAPNIVIRCAELEPHVLTAYGKYQYGLVINHLQFLIRDLSMRRSEALRRKRRGQPLTGRAAALLDVEMRATRVTDEMAVLIDDIMRDFDDERVRAVIAHVVTLKGEEKAKYLHGARAALSRAEAASVPEPAPAPAPAPRKRRAPAAAAASAKSRKKPSSKKKRR